MNAKTTDEAAETEIITPLLNREGALPGDGWFHLVKTGDHPIRIEGAGGKPRSVIQRLDARACEAIVADFQNRLAADPAHRVLIDFEHFSHDTGKSSEAAGWITALENRASGVWFQSDWSTPGRAAILERRYRFISPVWGPVECDLVAPGIYRPLRVTDAGLTNKPNIKGLTPFWNRAGDDTFNGREAATTATSKNTHMKDQLIALLGLPPEADEAAVLAAIKALKEGSDKAAEVMPLKNRLTALEARHKALLDESVTKELEANADVIPEGQKEAWKNRLENDYAGTAALLRGIKRPEATKKTPVHDAGKGAASAAKKTATGSGAGEDGSPFLNRVREVMAADKLTELQAIDKVAASDPALYRDYAEGLRFSGAES